jgi:hypothetical protein
MAFVVATAHPTTTFLAGGSNARGGALVGKTRNQPSAGRASAKQSKRAGGGPGSVATAVAQPQGKQQPQQRDMNRREAAASGAALALSALIAGPAVREKKLLAKKQKTKIQNIILATGFGKTKTSSPNHPSIIPCASDDCVCVCVWCVFAPLPSRCVLPILILDFHNPPHKDACIRLTVSECVVSSLPSASDDCVCVCVCVSLLPYHPGRHPAAAGVPGARVGVQAPTGKASSGLAATPLSISHHHIHIIYTFAFFLCVR